MDDPELIALSLADSIEDYCSCGRGEQRRIARLMLAEARMRGPTTSAFAELLAQLMGLGEGSAP